MSRQAINIGSAANDGTGDPLRTAFDKINDNFTELYDRFGGGNPNIEITGDSIVNKSTNSNITLTTNGTGTISLGADTSITGNLTYAGSTISGATNNLTTSTTALSLESTVHILASAEASYTLAAGSEGQVIHMVLGGGDSAANSAASVTVTVSQVRDPRDSDVLATYAWNPFKNPGSDLDDSTTATKTLATCVFAAGAWNLDNFVRL